MADDKNKGKDQGEITNAKKALESHPTAKAAYENEQGDWLFSTPDKAFGPVKKTYTKLFNEAGQVSKIIEQNGYVAYKAPEKEGK